MQGLKQELRMRQELTLQPQQILRAELIQLPILELEMRVNAEMEENPFLEENVDAVENPPEDEESLKPDSTTDEESEEVKEPVSDSVREVDWEDILNDSDHWEYRSQTRVSTEENTEIPQPIISTLSEKLIEQLHLDNLSREEQAIGEELIGNLNHDGYLEISLSELAQTLNKPVEMVETVHRRLTGYDPIGIGSRDLRECLLVQLRHRETAPPIAIRMVDEFWTDFINKRFEILAEKMEISLEEVKASFQIIGHLNPKPGEGYFDEKQNYVIPDLIVTKVAGEYVVYLNDGDIPNFRINPAYRDMFLNRKETADKQVRDFLARKLESARWFINAIHQRRSTMLRTMRSIVTRQEKFFERGPAYLRPMILAHIAEDIGMDISTISRVTNGKYAQTDWGIFELKYFFSERMEMDDGDEVSNRVIKARLQEIVAAEDKKQPYSDQTLTEVLNKEGFQIRRRTVAKYREHLRIPIKRMRREI
ncbi:MAG: RNA polymerase factor sigma-54 [Calditrichota bacterium]